MTEQEKEQYCAYVKEKTPVHSVSLAMFRAFWTGGLVCVIGQIITDWLLSRNLEKEAAAAWTSIILVAIAVLLTMCHVFWRITKYAGAGVLVPITGFANSIASPASEYAPEGEVFGKGVQIFSIAGPVILFGVLSSFVLGLLKYFIPV